MKRQRTTRVLLLTSLIMCMCLSWTARARADAVTDWNAIAIETIVNAMVNGVPAHPGGAALLDSAMVQAAVYDAVVAIDGRFKPYHVQIPGASGSPAAAVAKAAHDVLINRFPFLSDSLDMTYHDYLSSHGLAEDDREWQWDSKPPLASLRCEPTTGVSRRTQLLSSVGPTLVFGVQRLPPLRRW